MTCRASADVFWGARAHWLPKVLILRGLLRVLKHLGFGTEGEGDPFGVVPAFKLSEKASAVLRADLVRRGRRRNVHMIQLIEVLCSIPQQISCCDAHGIDEAAGGECRRDIGVIGSFLCLEIAKAGNIPESSIVATECCSFGGHVVGFGAGGRPPPGLIL